MNNPLIIGIDGGLANLGWSVLELKENDSLNLIDFGLIKTEKDKGNQKSLISGSPNNVQRMIDQYYALSVVLSQYKASIGCIEKFSQPRHASNAVKYAMSYSMASLLFEMNKIDTVYMGPKEIKFACVQNKSATKENIIWYVQNRFNIELSKKIGSKAIHNIEHPADAIALVCACINEEFIKKVRENGTINGKNIDLVVGC